MKKLAFALFAVIAITSFAFASNGHYVGDQGSSHKGGHYINERTGNHYKHRTKQ